MKKVKMHSISTKLTLMSVCFIVAAIVVTAVIGAVSLKKIGDSSSEQMLSMLCKTGERNLDYYFKSVELSVGMLSSFIETDLEGLEDEQLQNHMERVRGMFETTAYRTSGVYTYYYRIDPSVSDTVKGFWYTNLDGKGFIPHEVTDITQYDTEDTSKLVWFTVPKATGEGIWIPPYITDNLDVRVISYNTPIYFKGTFVGVVGIEIDYSKMAEEVNSLKLYENGYAFVTDANGRLVYHPHIDVTVIPDEEKPMVSEGLLKDDTVVNYKYEGIIKEAVSMQLHNGMRITVAVPVSEINSSWRQMTIVIAIVSLVLLVICIFMTMQFATHITKPLHELTEAALQVGKGNYDVDLDYRANDEVGILTRTFNQLVTHMKIHISDLDSMAHTDALTSVKNKGAYDTFIRELQDTVNDQSKKPEFAIAIFDCDDLKLINDRFGHDKGDLYLKNSSAIIRKVFKLSPVFRIGGDEFAVVMQGEDYNNREELAKLFMQKCEDTCIDTSSEWWNQVRVSMGLAVYDPNEDRYADDVARRADKLMYENKHARKAGRR